MIELTEWRNAKGHDCASGELRMVIRTGLRPDLKDGEPKEGLEEVSGEPEQKRIFVLR